MEVMAVLAIVAVATGLGAPSVRSLADTASVINARERIAAGVTHARYRAIASGGATLRVRGEPPSALLEVGDSVVELLGPEHFDGVSMNLGRRTEVTLRFDRLGLGRMASTTIRLQRGDVRRTLTLSAYGRVRR